MAKKSKSSKKRRQRKVNVPVYQVPAESAEKAVEEVVVSTGRAPISNPIASKDATTDSIDWAAEYPFYAPDMKRLGVIVALMVILLLALNFVFIYLL